MLTEEHKKQRVACALTFLMCYHKEGDAMVSHIVTGDKTWVSHITLENIELQLKKISVPSFVKIRSVLVHLIVFCINSGNVEVLSLCGISRCDL